MNLADILRASAVRVKSNSDAEDYVGGRANLAELVKGYGLKPIRQNGKVTQWDTKDLDEALDRAGVDGWPYPERSMSESATTK